MYSNKKISVLRALSLGYTSFCWEVECVTADEYRKLLAMDFDDVRPEDMPDLKKMRIDRSLPQDRRKSQYLKKVGNPYLVKVGNMLVKVRFANNGVTMEQAFENLLLNV